MAIRTIRVEGDRVLNKKAREVTAVTAKEAQLIDDMFETMYDADGVGLAAPQIGILKQIVTIDVGDEEVGPLVLINPKITEQDGEQTGDEGCLSVPGKVGTVTRPQHIVCEAFDREMNPIRIEAEDLLARCICHETDHLQGHLYTELAVGPLRDAYAPEETEE